MNFELLKQMCRIHAPSGNETEMTEFLLNYINTNKNSWKVQPDILAGDEFQDCIVLVFGEPKTAIFAHIDSIGFTVRYHNQLVKIGGPRTETGYKLTGNDSQGEIICTLNVDEDHNLSYTFDRNIDRGTMLTFLPEWIEDDNFVQCCYMDNRLGVFNALKVAETLQNGMICFSCWEETGGGSVEYLAKLMYEKYHIKQALISDITWVTEGVLHGQGCVISMRDSGLPRRKYVNKIIEIVKQKNMPFQLEVESSGGSDGNILHRSPYPIDWCFIGAPESDVHSPNEKVHKDDITSMIDMYKWLMQQL
ncbi:MAG TPA: M20/M25/M40 family metallo-hydrolase [Bacteroidia bacterium]|nr:M20/M25/M40 family metallo-hydrolase [Bacteroidia bacterium]